MPSGKEEIRKTVLEKRKALTESEIVEKSGRILQGLSLLQAFRQSVLVLCYMDFRNEVRTSGIIDFCLARGQKVAVPRCITTPEGRCDLEIYEIREPAADVRAGAYGIREPDRDRTRRVSPAEVGFALVPGVAFDGNRRRIGYGAGYYDRFLRSVGPACVKAGLAFELQMADEIPSEAHDMSMDLIITERRIIF